MRRPVATTLFLIATCFLLPQLGNCQGPPPPGGGGGEDIPLSLPLRNHYIEFAECKKSFLDDDGDEKLVDVGARVIYNSKGYYYDPKLKCDMYLNGIKKGSSPEVSAPNDGWNVAGDGVFPDDDSLDETVGPASVEIEVDGIPTDFVTLAPPTGDSCEILELRAEVYELYGDNDNGETVFDSYRMTVRVHAITQSETIEPNGYSIEMYNHRTSEWDEMSDEIDGAIFSSTYEIVELDVLATDYVDADGVLKVRSSGELYLVRKIRPICPEEFDGIW